MPPPDGVAMCRDGDAEVPTKAETSTNEVCIVGVDPAKQVFQVHGSAASGRVLFRKKLSRPRFSKLMAWLPPCVVAMEVYATVHYWAQDLSRYGHEVRLISPVHVQPFVERQRETDQETIWGIVFPPNNAADAEAIAEVSGR